MTLCRQIAILGAVLCLCLGCVACGSGDGGGDGGDVLGQDLGDGGGLDGGDGGGDGGGQMDGAGDGGGDGVAAPTVVINELACRDGDWAELLNVGPDTVSLEGLTLAYEGEGLGEDQTWTMDLPAGLTIGPGQRFLASTDAVGGDAALYCGRGALVLGDGKGAQLDRVRLTPVMKSLTLGRLPEGSGKLEPNSPSPNAPNVKAPNLEELLFNPGRILQVDLTMPQESLNALGGDPRTYVTGTFQVTGEGLPAESVTVGLRIKGKAGSYRTLDQKAALKVKFNWADQDGRFLGLKKLTLNNMVQDPSFIHEVLAYRLFAAMGVPAPGTGYAKVRLNGADLGLYLVLEAQDDVFASRNYGGTGHLYEGEYGQDLVPSQVDFLQMDEGDEDGRADLQALVAAANLEGDGWYEALGQVADVPELVKMWAVEQYIGHWDGYAPTINNYWVHSDDRGQFTMWPGGTDQTFADTRDYFQGYGLLFGRCMNHSQCRRDFERALGLLLQVVPVLGLEAQAQTLMTGLSEAVQWDPRKEVSHEDFLWAVQATIDFLLGRKASLAEAIGCLLDENADKDGDGYVCDQDCDETDKATHVGAQDTCGDGLDQDCSGVADDGLDCPDCDEEWRGPHRYLFCTNRRNFADADAHCQEYGSRLVLSDGPYEDLWLRQAMDRRGFGECWLGISDEALEGTWMTVTGTTQQYFSWADGEPNNCCGGENCGEYWAWGRWNDVTCLDANPVVCEDTCPEGLDSDGDGFGRCGEDCDDDRKDVFPGAPEDCFDGVDQDCNGLVDDTGCWTCEELSSSQGEYLLCPYGGGLQAAGDYCAAWGGRVLVIGDEGENYWVKTTLMNSGLDRVWLGISDGTSEGQWADLDGEEITFAAWGNGEPNDSGGIEDCANLYTSGFWNDLPCNGTHPVICEKP